MALDKRHYMPKKEDREHKTKWHPIYKYGSNSKKEYERIENLLDEISVDVCNGLTFSEIILHLKQGDRYEHQTKPIKDNTIKQYIDAVKSRLALDRSRDVEQVKDVLYTQYINLYREALEGGNLITAKSVLDSLIKLYGIDKPAQQTAVQINTNKENLNINFGFPDNEVVKEDSNAS